MSTEMLFPAWRRVRLLDTHPTTATWRNTTGGMGAFRATDSARRRAWTISNIPAGGTVLKRKRARCLLLLVWGADWSNEASVRLLGGACSREGTMYSEGASPMGMLQMSRYSWQHGGVLRQGTSQG